MNTLNALQAPKPDLLHPELWLLLVHPADEPDARPFVERSLHHLAALDALAAWRQRHRRVRVVSGAELQAELQAALAAGCPAVRVHASLDGRALCDRVDAFNLPSPSERLVNLQGWGRPLAEWWPRLADELTRPDAWVEVGWRLSRGASVPLLAMPGDEASAASYRQAFDAWLNERFRPDDVHLFAGDDDEEPLAGTVAPPASSATAESSYGPDDDVMPWPLAVSSAMWARPEVPGARGGRVGVGVAGASPAGGFAAAPSSWFPIVDVEGRMAAPDGPGHWPFKISFERRSREAGASWSEVRARLTWTTPEIREKARLFAFRLFLMPRVQPAVVAHFEREEGVGLIAKEPSAVQRIRSWAGKLPETPLVLVALR